MASPVTRSRSPQKAGSKRKDKAIFESLPYDVQEEIECLYEFVPEVADHFEVIGKIGEGTFSSVFLARLKKYPDASQLFALKHIIPTSHPSRIEGELKCLLEIGGVDNVMGVELCLRSKDHVVIVMQYFPHEKFHDYLLRMSLSDVVGYMQSLLTALRRVHQFNIIHRDVKPSNFLYDSKTKRYTLVDFGLAHKAQVGRKVGGTTGPGRDGASPMDSTSNKKGILTASQDSPNPNTADSRLHEKKPMSDPSALKTQQYTPPTPNLSNAMFAKRVKSPRRLLLAKRALLIQEKQDSILSHRKSHSSHSSHQYLPAACQCFGKPQICSLCSSRSNQVAPRAGTPGFRSPEVLMKCPDQSTAVDIWSAGVIFLSLLSGRYPFFRANDDMTALAQIISTMGSEPVKVAAEACGKNIICSPAQQPVNLRTLCSKLRTAPVSKMQTSRKYDKENVAAEATWRSVPDSAYDLLQRLLDLNPYTRITAQDALSHPFFTEHGS